MLDYSRKFDLEVSLLSSSPTKSGDTPYYSNHIPNLNLVDFLTLERLENLDDRLYVIEKRIDNFKNKRLAEIKTQKEKLNKLIEKINKKINSLEEGFNEFLKNNTSFFRCHPIISRDFNRTIERTIEELKQSKSRLELIESTEINDRNLTLLDNTKLFRNDLIVACNKINMTFLTKEYKNETLNETLNAYYKSIILIIGEIKESCTILKDLSSILENNEDRVPLELMGQQRNNVLKLMEKRNTESIKEKGMVNHV